MPAQARGKGEQLSPIPFENFVCARSGARYTPSKITTCLSAGMEEMRRLAWQQSYSTLADLFSLMACSIHGYLADDASKLSRDLYDVEPPNI
jgi:hypothetical protein